MKSPLERQLSVLRVARRLVRHIFLCAACGVLIVAGVLGWRTIQFADLGPWLRDIRSGSALETIFFVSATLPSGPVIVRRPPREAVKSLDALVAAKPDDPELLAYRAREEEAVLDFPAAETDWKKYAGVAKDSRTAQVALADFYARSLQPNLEVQALSQAARLSASGADLMKPAREQESWRLFERIQNVIRDQALPTSTGAEEYEAWLKRYPDQPEVYHGYFEYVLAGRDFKAATDLVERYQKAFPDDPTFVVEGRAEIAYTRGSTDAAIRVYDRGFEPLWPAPLVKNYFDLLKKTRRERDFLARARTALAANPNDLNAATGVFYYYQQEGNLPEAERALADFRQNKESASATGASGAWTAKELYTLAKLSEDVNSFDEAARYYYALYSLPGVDPADAEQALGGLTRVLLTAPEAPIRFGMGNLSLYRDIASMDSNPGFLNGLLSLLFNSASPRAEYADEEQASVAYFHRARAERLIALVDSRFPKSGLRPALHAQMIQAYASYGADDGVIKAGRRFLSDFPDAPQRTEVSLRMADADARADRPNDEFAIYDSLLKELAARSEHIPLGQGAAEEPGDQQASVATSPEPTQPRPRLRLQAPPDQAMIQSGQEAAPPARSVEYSQVLDRYLARLVSLKRLPDGVKVFHGEISRNPDDPGLYERFAAFLDQNRLGSETEEVYRMAMTRFPDESWYDRLARWYLRRRRTSDLSQLTHQVVDTFSGTDLENYFARVVGQTNVGARMYLQLNLYAHEHFPHNMTFVRNLLNAYSARETPDAQARETLLRENWLNADDLRNRYFAGLAQNDKIESELSATERTTEASNGTAWDEIAAARPAAARFIAEGRIWQSHFERAAPAINALSNEYPADADLGPRALSLNRSLASGEPTPENNLDQAFHDAIAIADRLGRADPANHEYLTALGEIYADRSLLTNAAAAWNRLRKIAPGRQEGYLETATIFWDYFEYQAALDTIATARKQFHDPTLYAYEAGAIYENQRDYRLAIQEYVHGALAPQPGEEARQPSSPARTRLLQLARRPALRTLVDAATVPPTDPPSVEALSLRVAILEAESDHTSLESFLSQAISRAASLDLLERIGVVAANDGLEQVQRQSLEKQITVSDDPVHTIELRLALATFYESREQIPAATQVIADLVRDNPRIMGVVRAATDFYWRNKMPDRAVETLIKSADSAYPALKKQFTFEAARKATEAGQYGEARSLLDALLAQNPYNTDNLTARADTFARAGDDRGLRDFYVTEIALISKAQIAPADRTRDLAALRRGLIPALTRLKDYADATDQYIEVIKLFPEDAGLASEAALYSADHAQQQRLLGYFAQAIKDSPRDPRWMLVTARLKTALEDFAGAIEAYDEALVLRPERTDIYIAKGDLEDRLTHFDAAATTYEKLYDLTYHDSQWMERVAEERARLGQQDATVEALEKARVRNQPERASNFFAVASRLESWNMLEPARRYAERGAGLAGKELLTDPANEDGLSTYARIMTRLRKQEAVFDSLDTAAREATAAAASADKEQQDGILQVVNSTLAATFSAVGEAVQIYFTPEEKAAFVALCEARRAQAPASYSDAWLALARSAELTDMEAKWRGEALLSKDSFDRQSLTSLAELQQRCLRFESLGTQLQTYAGRLAGKPGSSEVWQQAAQAFRAAGDDDGELRALGALETSGELQEDVLTRYFDVLRKHDPEKLADLARIRRNNREKVADQAAQFAISSGNEQLALNVLAGRGQGLPPVWTSAYTALTGFYDDDSGEPINSAFSSILNRGTIGDQIGRAVDTSRQLAGDAWYYYGARYGDFLIASRRDGADDYLPAALEGRPGDPNAYLGLADDYLKWGRSSDALGDYDRALQLNPLEGDAEDRAAQILWDRGQHDEAVDRWREALKKFARQQDLRQVPESFWQDVAATLDHIGSHKLLPEVRPEADSLLRTYVRRNGEYRAEPLMQAAYNAAGDPGDGVNWILDLSRAANDPSRVLESLVDSKWLPAAERRPLYLRILDLQHRKVAEALGPNREFIESESNRWRMEWITYLVDRGELAEAQQALNAIPRQTRSALEGQLVPLTIRIAAADHRLPALLDGYRAIPDEAPSSETLRLAAKDLADRGDGGSARQVREYLYTRELDRRNLDAGNFLGLAEVRLQQGNKAAAVALLRRMMLVAPAGEEEVLLTRNHSQERPGAWSGLAQSAADLLASYKGHAQAAEFLDLQVKAEPWSAEARLQRAKEALADHATGDSALQALASISSDPAAPYDTRAEATRTLGALHARMENQLSGELGALAAGHVSSDVVGEPYAYFARMSAADAVSGASERFALLRNALEMRPSSDLSRIDLFEAALQARQFELAVKAFEPLTESLLPSTYEYQNEGDNEKGDDDETESSRDGNQGQSTRTSHSRSDQARWAGGLAQAYEALDQLDLARTYLQMAARLQASQPARQEIRKQIDALTARISVRQQNVERAPVVSKEVAQPVIVKPRLVESAVGGTL